MTARSPELPALISTAVESYLGDLFTAIPGRFETYDHTKQTGDVKPMVQRLVKTEEGELAEELPVIPDVPVWFPRTDKAFISLPVKKGDFCLLVFCQWSIDKLLETAGDEKVATNPDDFRDHDPSDAIAIPGVFPHKKNLTATHADNIVIGFDNGHVVHVKEGEIALTKENPSDHVALASLVKAELDKIQSKYDGHTHTTTATIGPSAVPGVISPPTPLVGPIPDVKSPTVRSD